MIDMKMIGKIVATLCGCLLLGMLTGCKTTIAEFGFDGSVSGTLKDAGGQIVSGDVTSNSLIIRLLGENDLVTTDIRVNGDGTYRNTKLFPQKYKMWVVGPVSWTGDTVRVDFASEKTVVKDFQVTPFLRVAAPTVVGTPSASEVNVAYEITAADGQAVAIGELYCSTNPYPTTTTGSGPFFDTRKITLTGNTGDITVTGLAAKTKYFIRVAAQASGTSMFNFSDQVVITTP